MPTRQLEIGEEGSVCAEHDAPQDPALLSRLPMSGARQPRGLQQHINDCFAQVRAP
jgi:hypothetical protein